MKTLIIGGTGLISTGIVKHLLARGADVTLLNRGRRHEAPAGVRTLTCDRNSPGALSACLSARRFDVVIDMICFTPEQAQATIDAVGGRVQQLIFCSTVCTYGVLIPPHVLIDESFEQQPTTQYGKDKVRCERLFEAAAAAGKFALTVVRPSNTYGPGASLIDQMEFDGTVWDRVEQGLPVLCAGDGLGLWQATHRDDVGKLFAYAAGNPKTFGEAFNATRDHVFTWRDYYREAAEALGTRAELVLAPAGWVIRQNPERFSFLSEIARYHGAYSSEKAKAAVPEFRCSFGFVEGARETLADMKQRGAWRRHQDDAEYSALVQQALAQGFETITA